MSKIMSVNQSWQMIHDTLDEFAPQRLKNLRGPANESAIGKLEEKIEVVLPDDLRESLLVHNGEEWQGQGILSRAWELLGTEDIVYHHVLLNHSHFSEEAQVWYLEFGTTNDLDWDDPQLFARVKKTLYDPAWIPIAHSGGGNYLFLDLAPELKGKQGQVLSWIKSYGPEKTVAASFSAHLSGVARRLSDYYQKRASGKN
ncbi:SMI1/KNR4 family protein [Deinococcus sp. SM5_A1]|uniref:SMI1/KNR4 family protein n=1 Tax=Deinococcus sp. SM5_A1 TaxID=3379094 RepID=UPI00385C79EC